jgi:hypothetical protein
LEGVLGIVVAQQAAADAPHHRAVPPDESGEGGFVVAFDETAQQFAVAKPRPVRQRHGPAKVVNHPIDRIGPHVPPRTDIAARPLPYSCRTPTI